MIKDWSELDYGYEPWHGEDLRECHCNDDDILEKCGFWHDKQDCKNCKYFYVDDDNE